MKNIDLLYLIGKADDELIEHAEIKNQSVMNKSRKWFMPIIAAACFCIAVIVLFLFTRTPQSRIIVKGVDNIEELSSVYDGTLLAENLLTTDAVNTDIKLSYTAGGDITDSSTWDSLSVSTKYNGEDISLNCSFSGPIGEYDPSNLFDIVNYGDVAVTIYREESEWGDKFSLYRAVFTYNGAAYNLTVNSTDTDSIYNYLLLVLDEPQSAGSKIDNVMGFDVCRVEVEASSLFHTMWHYYAEIDGVERCIGERFGFNGPEAWSVDLDGDGVTELVCNCTGGADGVTRVFVFRNNGGVIELGRIDGTYYYINELGFDYWGAGGISESYDPEKNVFVVKNYMRQGEIRTETFTGIELFEFSEFVCSLSGS